MDLVAIHILGDEREPLRAQLRDGHGQKTIVLTAAEAAPLLALAQPLTAIARAQHDDSVGVSIDYVARQLTPLRPLGKPNGDVVSGAPYEAQLAALTALARATLTLVRQRSGDPGPSATPGSPSDVQFWQGLYELNRDGWELARPAPPLASWFAQHSATGKKTLVVGCGRGHEARLLAAHGAEVIAVDFAADAIAAARALAAHDEKPITFLERDLFTLADDETLRGQIDLVVEHCCFCAIDPARRDEYVKVMAQLVRKGGELVGLFYSHGRAGGPPFSVGEDDLVRHFAAGFTLESMTTPNDSVASRQGDERLAHFRRSLP